METETKAPSLKLTVRCQFCNTWNRIDASKVTDGPKCGKCTKPILLERPFPLNDETFSRTISDSDVQKFGEISGDFNPAHFNEEYAKGTIFKNRIAHGMISVAKSHTGGRSITMPCRCGYRVPIEITMPPEPPATSRTHW